MNDLDFIHDSTRFSFDDAVAITRLIRKRISISNKHVSASWVVDDAGLSFVIKKKTWLKHNWISRLASVVDLVIHVIDRRLHVEIDARSLETLVADPALLTNEPQTKGR